MHTYVTQMHTCGVNEELLEHVQTHDGFQIDLVFKGTPVVPMDIDYHHHQHHHQQCNSFSYGEVIRQYGD